jgi:hypothetical protein
MASRNAPSKGDLLSDPTVQATMEQAWIDSDAADPARRHEEGGWIYMDTSSGTLETRRAPSGAGDSIDLGIPPAIDGSVIVGTFHTHPNPIAEGWEPGPSMDDAIAAMFSGVPWLIRAEDGYHVIGPEMRRGGLTGNPGYPA